MIMDQLKNAGLYKGLHPNIDYALQYLQTHPIVDMAPGKYEIKGEDIFLLIQTYDTRSLDEGFWEAHRTYTDIQYIIEGSELMGVAHIENLKLTEDHLDEKDYVVLEGDGNFLKVEQGIFVVFYPHDAHMPCLFVDQPAQVKKAVMKVRIV